MSKLTEGQKLLWTGSKINPDVPLYNVAFTFDIYGEVDSEIFIRSFQELINLTDTLRTTFVEKNGIPNSFVSIN